MKKILTVLAVLCCTVFFSCKSGSGSGDPKAVLSQFFEALSKKDIEAARKLATKESKQMIDMMEMGLKMSKDDKTDDKFNKDNMEIGEAKIDGDKALVPVKEKTSGESLNYSLIKEEGSWKVAFDKASLMSMGMEKMNEKGVNLSDSIGNAMDELKNMNMDSLKDEMKKGMDMADSMKSMMNK